MMEVQEDKELCTSANRVVLKPEELEKSLKLRHYLCNKILECEIGGEEEKCNDGDEYSTKKFYEISKDGDKVIGKVSLWNVVLAMVDSARLDSRQAHTRGSWRRSRGASPRWT